jgi:hypothetical protein
LELNEYYDGLAAKVQGIGLGFMLLPRSSLCEPLRLCAFAFFQGNRMKPFSPTKKPKEFPILHTPLPGIPARGVAI